MSPVVEERRGRDVEKRGEDVSGRHTMKRRFESRRAVREVKPDEIIGYEKRFPMGSLTEHVVGHDSNRALLCAVRRSLPPLSARAASFSL